MEFAIAQKIKPNDVEIEELTMFFEIFNLINFSFRECILTIAAEENEPRYENIIKLWKQSIIWSKSYYQLY